MTDRRNHYRTLHLQPDANVASVKTNYRTLMQKLRLHPDLGGDDRHAALINQAYATLKNPSQRARYDDALLRKHDIATLSRGKLQPRAGSVQGARTAGACRRNYYRLLQVQTDAPTAVIEESYRAALKTGTLSRDLLDTIYDTLMDPAKRAQYDRSLVGARPVQGHTGAPDRKVATNAASGSDGLRPSVIYTRAKPRAATPPTPNRTGVNPWVRAANFSSPLGSSFSTAV